MGDPRAAAPLIAALEDAELAPWAAMSLGTLGLPVAVEPLVALLESGDHGSACAASSLGKIGDARAVSPLIAALENADTSVRSTAAKALGAIGDLRAVGPLILGGADANEWVGVQAISALGSLGWQQCGHSDQKRPRAERERTAINRLAAALGDGRSEGMLSAAQVLEALVLA